MGTFADAHDPGLAQNVCFLYHVIGGETGDWDVPVGGMSAGTGELARAAKEAGADLVTGHEVLPIEPNERLSVVTYNDGSGEATVGARKVLVNSGTFHTPRATTSWPRPTAKPAAVRFPRPLRRRSTATR